MKLIPRPQYLERLIELRHVPDIKVITGIRRSGKSKLLEAFSTWIKENEPQANIIAIDFNDPDWLRTTPDGFALYDYVKLHRVENVENYVLIDEVQNCPGFERAINGLHASEQYRIYITGSNAFLLNSDLATLFTGRTFEIEVFPFSLKEFMTFFEITDVQEALDRYVIEGGLAGSYIYSDIRERRAYVKNVYQTLIVRDIQQKYKIRQSSLLTKLSEFLMDNISNLTSSNGIAEYLTNCGNKATDMTVAKYLSYLCSAFLLYKMRRYDIRGKRYLTTQDKYYLADHTFRYALLGARNMDYGRVYENMVAVELLRRGYEVYAGYLYKKEIDFVAMRGDEKIYIQVSDSISEPKTFQREVDSLLKIRDVYPKLLITRTRHDEYDYEGIRIIDLPKWLAQQ